MDSRPFSGVDGDTRRIAALAASGTSGMKVVLNGGLNLSPLDDRWAEAYDGRNGFTIGLGETHVSTDVHDSRDRDSLIEVLRNEVVLLYYDRDRDSVPPAWVARMKRAMRTLGGRFSPDRMARLRAEIVRARRGCRQQRMSRS